MQRQGSKIDDDCHTAAGELESLSGAVPDFSTTGLYYTVCLEARGNGQVIEIT